MGFLRKRAIKYALLPLEAWLQRHNRKQVITNTSSGEPTLIRYSLFATKSDSTALSREPLWGNIYLHKFLRSEEFDLHDHPWPFVSLVLSGSYREILPGGKERRRKAGSLSFFPARWIHRVLLDSDEACWTLLFRGRHQRQWGYHLASGWVPARSYLERMSRPPIRTLGRSSGSNPSGPVVEDRWKGQLTRILLLGADGLICPHMAEHLMDYHPDTQLIVVGDGPNEARVRDSVRFARQATAKKIRFFQPHAFSPNTMKDELGTVDAVVAFDAYGQKTSASAIKLVQQGVVGTLHALETASLLKAKHFTLVSSGDVHGPLERRKPYHPNDRTKPLTLDKAALIGAEAFVQAWSKNHDGQFTIVRVPEIFGERMPGHLAFAQFLKTMINGEAVRLRSHQDKRGRDILGAHHYIHARDAARAILHATFYGTSGETYNLTGKYLDDLELVERLAHLTGLHPQIEKDSAPGNGYRFGLEETLGPDLEWRPPHGFDISLRNTVSWILNPRHRQWFGT